MMAGDRTPLNILEAKPRDIRDGEHDHDVSRLPPLGRQGTTSGNTYVSPTLCGRCLHRWEGASSVAISGRNSLSTVKARRVHENSFSRAVGAGTTDKV